VLRLVLLTLPLALLSGCNAPAWIAVWTDDGLAVIDGPHDASRVILREESNFPDPPSVFSFDFSPDAHHLSLDDGRVLDLAGGVRSSRGLDRIAWHPEGQRLLGADDGELLEIDVDGSSSTVEVEGCDHLHDAAWKGDGSALAVVCRPDGGGSDSFQIRVVDQGTDEVRVLGEGTLFDTDSWSWPVLHWGDAPAIIVAVTWGAGGGGLSSDGLHAIEEDGSEIRTLRSGQLLSSSLSPGGTRLLSMDLLTSTWELLDTADWSSEELGLDPSEEGWGGWDWLDEEQLCFTSSSEVIFYELSTGETRTYNPSQTGTLYGSISCHPG